MAEAGLDIINNFLKTSMLDIFEQLTAGIANPSAQFSKVAGRSEVGVELWKAYIEAFTGVKFHCTVNVAADTITLLPHEPMSPKSLAASVASGLTDQISDASQPLVSPAPEIPSTTTSLASPPSASVADDKSSTKDKVPRPPNAFIIYRKEWHSKIVRENPNLHNNEISVIIGRKWKAETEAVRNEYKSKADNAKRQHAIDHPGYQYQPRKPSEKKKRMTKTKVAKLKAQANVAMSPDPTKDLEKMLAAAATDNQITVDTFQAPYHQSLPNLQPSQEDNTHLTFDATSEDVLLANQLLAWNATAQGPAGSMYSKSAVLESQPLANGQNAVGVPQLDMPYFFTYPNSNQVTSTTSAPCFNDATAEVERQQSSDEGFEGFLDFDAFVLEY